MIWIGGRVVLVDMTRGARGRRTRKLSVHVTLRAGNCFVSSSQRECGLRVVKAGGQPSSRGMAGIARGGEAAGLMVWIGRPVVIGHVAGSAIHWRVHELAADVTLGAGHVDVQAGQWELGELAVIELGVIPVGGGVAE